MRINHKLLRYTRIELAIATWRIIKADHLHADDLSDVDTVPHDRLHQLAVVLHHWRLPGVEAVGFGPAQTKTNAQAAHFRGGIDSTWIFGHIQAWDTDLACHTYHAHQRVEHGGRGFLLRARMAVAARLVPGTTGTDAHQSSRNLVLDPNAEADSRPWLRILADDVRCTHGATISQVVPEHIFYLQARGIPYTEAQKLIVEGFFRPVIDRIPVEEIEARIQLRVDRESLAHALREPLRTETGQNRDGHQRRHEHRGAEEERESALCAAGEVHEAGGQHEVGADLNHADPAETYLALTRQSEAYRLSHPDVDRVDAVIADGTWARLYSDWVPRALPPGWKPGSKAVAAPVLPDFAAIAARGAPEAGGATAPKSTLAQLRESFFTWDLYKKAIPDLFRTGLPNTLILTGGDGRTTVRVVVRPSGTEPKLKSYTEVRCAPTDDLTMARARAYALNDELATAAALF